MKQYKISTIFLVLLLQLSMAAAALTVTSPFGWRTHPITGELSYHTGTDIAAESGTPIAAIWGGKVVFAEQWGGYGYCIIIDHGNSRYTLYAHCSSFAVQTNENVVQGQIIAYVGSTGNSTGPHLHLEVWENGKYVDPMTVFGNLK